ncbi:MAG: precorrin-8X methylmutase, partial [Isosphaeraceae bacterium]|nr:precorrin-8X methylmutase [Isosphaeraceae bacterium]
PGRGRPLPTPSPRGEGRGEGPPPDYRPRTKPPCQIPEARDPRPEVGLGERIMAESLAIIDRELGPEPSDPAERAVVRRMIHASADFDFARAVRFGPGAIAAALRALRSGATIVTDVGMLRAGISTAMAGPLGVRVVCGLDLVEGAIPPDLTRTAAGVRRAAAELGDGIMLAVGNAPTALIEAIRLVEQEGWRPACLVGIPVGFVGVEESKQRLAEQRHVPFLTSLGRKGGTAVTAAAINALLELAGAKAER